MEDYVTFEQAQILKELGFDWECNHFYFSNTRKLVENYRTCSNGNPYWTMTAYEDHNHYRDYISAPTLSQVQKWLREIKGIIICIGPGFYRNKRPLMGYDYHLFNKDDGWYSYIESETVYDTYEQSLSASIDKALELLK